MTVRRQDWLQRRPVGPLRGGLDVGEVGRAIVAGDDGRQRADDHMLGGGRGRCLDGNRCLVCRHELDRAGDSRKRYGALAGAAEVAANLTVPITVLVDVAELEPGHHTSSQELGAGLSCESASKARSRERMSHTLRASILIAAGILPSVTISSNLAAEIRTYIAASSRDRPRRGTGRISERARVIDTYWRVVKLSRSLQARPSSVRR